MKHDTTFGPKDVLAMPLAKFERIYGFRPADALEKYWFAVNGKRLNDITRAFMKLSDSVPCLDNVVME